MAFGFIKVEAGTKRISIFPKILSTPSLIEACSYLGFRDEGPSRDGEAAVDGAEVLSHDGEATPLSAARTGCQPLGGENPLIQNCDK